MVGTAAGAKRQTKMKWNSEKRTGARRIKVDLGFGGLIGSADLLAWRFFGLPKVMFNAPKKYRRTFGWPIWPAKSRAGLLAAGSPVYSGNPPLFVPQI